MGMDTDRSQDDHHDSTNESQHRTDPKQDASAKNMSNESQSASRHLCFTHCGWKKQWAPCFGIWRRNLSAPSSPKAIDAKPANLFRTDRFYGPTKTNRTESRHHHIHRHRNRLYHTIVYSATNPDHDGLKSRPKLGADRLPQAAKETHVFFTISSNRFEFQTKEGIVLLHHVNGFQLKTEQGIALLQKFNPRSQAEH
jgi:hypothetical protein